MENKRKEKNKKVPRFTAGFFLLPFAAAVFFFPTAAFGFPVEVEAEATETEAAEAERATERVATEDVVVAVTSTDLITTVVSTLFTIASTLLGGSYLLLLFTLLPASLNDPLVEVGTYLSVCPFLDDLIWYRF